MVTQNPKREIVKADILIEGNKIKQVGGANKADKTLDATGCAVIPGLINAHTHSAMTLMRGIADDMNLAQFLEKTFKVDAVRTREDIRIGAELAALEMLRSGNTTFLDMYYFLDEVAKVVGKSGMRAYLGWGVLDERFTTQKGSPLKNCEKFIAAHSQMPRVKPLVAPQGVYVCSEETLLGARELAEKRKTLLHMHLSETRKEVYEHQKKTGKRPVEWLADIGFLCNRLSAAHCAWLTINEIKLMSKNKVSAVHCPVSNMKLASGQEAPVPEMQEHGIAVGLGTDGCSSQNRLDMWGEMKTCALLHKAQRLDSTVMPAQKVFDMATIVGAKVLGAEKELGSIEAGKFADLAIIDLKHPAMVPASPLNLVSHLVYSCQSDCVRDVLVDGQLVVNNGKVLTLNEKKIVKNAQETGIKLQRL